VPRELSAHQIQRHQAEVKKLNTEKGWYDQPVPFIQAMALLLTEINEAHDAKHSESHQAFGSELADVYIRLLDDCSRFGVDLVTATDIYRFPVRATTGEIDTDLWFVIAPIVNAIEAYRVEGLGFEDKAGPEIRRTFAQIYHNLEAVCRTYAVDLELTFGLKMAKNWTRPYRHGGKLA
jgi:NTP pyrophosphatase (non-canonical NTP hydrolase)